MARDGLTVRETGGGLVVMRLHYSADAAKDPTTVEGQRWLQQQSQGYPLGVVDPSWLKEMELAYSALGGTMLFPLWGKWRDSARVVIDPMEARLDGARFYGSYDYGWRTPSAYYVHAVRPDGHKYTLWEFYDAEVPVATIAAVIQGKDQQLADGRFFPGNPYAGKEALKIADARIFAEDQRGDEDQSSIAKLFRRYGVSFVPGKKGGDIAIANWLVGELWADPQAPQYQICTSCPRLLGELPRLRRKQLSSIVAKTRNQPEAIVDKDNHAWDCIKVFLHQFPVGVAARQAPQGQPGTFAWWQGQTRGRRRGRSALASSYTRR